MEHGKRLLIPCEFKWLVNLSFRLKAIAQMWHVNGLLSLWIALWRFKWSFLLNDLPHTLQTHAKLESFPTELDALPDSSASCFIWVFMWSCSSCWDKKVPSQLGHLNDMVGKLLRCFNKWRSSFSRRLYPWPQTWQEKGFQSEWLSICRSKWYLRLKALPQVVQLNELEKKSINFCSSNLIHSRIVTVVCRRIN